MAQIWTKPLVTSFGSTAPFYITSALSLLLVCLPRASELICPLLPPLLPPTEAKAIAYHSLWARGTYGLGELQLTRLRARLWAALSKGSTLAAEAGGSFSLGSISGMLPLPSSTASWRFNSLLAFPDGCVSARPPNWVWPQWPRGISAHHFIPTSSGEGAETCFICASLMRRQFLWKH